MNTLIENVRQWGVDKGITGPNGRGTIQKQFRKFVEEMAELFAALQKEDVKETRDALGDLQVVAVQANSLVNGIDTYPQDFHHFNPASSIELLASYSLESLMNDQSSAFTMVRAISVQLGHDPDECLQEAYDVISKRTGTMTNGVFVKDGKEEA